MRPLAFGFVLLGAAAILAGSPVCSLAAGPKGPQSSAIDVYFSPNGGATAAICKEIHAAKASVLVQAYSFTSVPIAQALVEAHRRGVKVEVILDKPKTAEEKHSQADYIRHAGVSTYTDGEHKTAHNKLMIIDGSVVITGSFNLTNHSEVDNAENLLVIRDKALAEKYTANWKVHSQHAVAYEAKSASEAVPQGKSHRKKAA